MSPGGVESDLGRNDSAQRVVTRLTRAASHSLGPVDRRCHRRPALWGGSNLHYDGLTRRDGRTPFSGSRANLVGSRFQGHHRITPLDQPGPLQCFRTRFSGGQPQGSRVRCAGATVESGRKQIGAIHAHEQVKLTCRTPGPPGDTRITHIRAGDANRSRVAQRRDSVVCRCCHPQFTACEHRGARTSGHCSCKQKRPDPSSREGHGRSSI